MKTQIKNILYIAVSSLILLGSLTPALAAEVKKMAVLPFDMYAQEDLEFLRKGIQDMLSSRLARPGKVEIIDRAAVQSAMAAVSGPVDKAAARQIAQALGADYVVYGSLTVFGTSISTSAHCLDAENGQNVVEFNESGKDQGDVITHVSTLADQVGNAALGLQPRVAQAPAATPVKPKDEYRQHPEALLADDRRPQEITMTEEGGAAVAAASATRWISPKFDIQAKGIAVGDVDGDGNNEIVLAGSHALHIFRYLDNRLQRVWSLEEKSRQDYLGVDVADTDSDGKAEIFVTNHPANSAFLESFVVAFDGAEFKKIAKNQRWFFRVLDTPERGRILVGQRKGSSRGSTEFAEVFRGNVMELQWQNGEYVAENRVNIPRSVTGIYNFALGDVMDAGGEAYVAYSGKNLLRIYSSGGNEEWAGTDAFGQTGNYMEIPDKNTDMEGGRRKDTKRIYLPVRIVVADADGNGNADVFVARNKETAAVLGRVKSFKNGRIECLSWNGMGLVSKWHTQDVTRYISDLAVADVDNDGRKELLYAVVNKNRSGFSKGRSHIVTQELPQPKAAATEEVQISN